MDEPRFDRKGKPGPIAGSATPPETQKLAGDVDVLRRALRALVLAVGSGHQSSAGMVLALREAERALRDTKPK